MKPAGRSAASRPLNNEPRCPEGPSLRCIPADFIAASSGMDMSSYDCASSHSRVVGSMGLGRLVVKSSITWTVLPSANSSPSSPLVMR